MNLNLFMDDGIKTIITTAKNFYLGSIRGQRFIGSQLIAAASAAKTRQKIEDETGTHVPAFLIASVASQCNLFCTGCYARANSDIGEGAKQLDAASWNRIFDEAEKIGVTFILLAGGEPCTRPDVIRAAAQHKKMLFPLFTNGTMFDTEMLDFVDANRNIIPIISIEGDQQRTDKRRGSGVFKRVASAQAELKSRKILYGVSITVTTENIDEVTSPSYVSSLREAGCGAIIFVEYAPMVAGTEYLALDTQGQRELCQRTEDLSAMKENNGTIIIAFPGSEEKMGGCLAAGRGFFHINQLGGAEPCPFSPFSSINVAQDGLLSALQSPFFEYVREIEAADILSNNGHMGGCTLLKHEEEVKAILAQQETQLPSMRDENVRAFVEKVERR